MFWFQDVDTKMQFKNNFVFYVNTYFLERSQLPTLIQPIPQLPLQPLPIFSSTLNICTTSRINLLQAMLNAFYTSLLIVYLVINILIRRLLIHRLILYILGCRAIFFVIQKLKTLKRHHGLSLSLSVYVCIYIIYIYYILYIYIRKDKRYVKN